MESMSSERTARALDVLSAAIDGSLNDWGATTIILAAAPNLLLLARLMFGSNRVHQKHFDPAMCDICDALNELANAVLGASEEAER